MLLQTKPESHAGLHQQFTGPVGGDRAPARVDEQAGFAPPSWWRGDDYASRSGIAAAATLRRVR